MGIKIYVLKKWVNFCPGIAVFFHRLHFFGVKSSDSQRTRNSELEKIFSTKFYRIVILWGPPQWKMVSREWLGLYNEYKNFESSYCDIRNQHPWIYKCIWFWLVKKEIFFSWYLWGTPGTKIMNVAFRGIKLKKVIRNDPLFKPDTNKSILKGAAKWPYPPSSFVIKIWMKFLIL